MLISRMMTTVMLPLTLLGRAPHGFPRFAGNTVVISRFHSIRARGCEERNPARDRGVRFGGSLSASSGTLTVTLSEVLAKDNGRWLVRNSQVTFSFLSATRCAEWATRNSFYSQ
jgi:hypothetical protein